MDTVPPGLAAQLRQMADAQGWLPPWPQWWGEEALTSTLEPVAVPPGNVHWYVTVASAGRLLTTASNHTA